MSRPRSGSPLTHPDVRLIAGRLCFAAAAHAAGDTWGSTRLEAQLGFRPTSRVRRTALSPTSGRKKRDAPTGCCKRWLRGHVPQDQTLRLISQSSPHVAAAIRRWRDGGLVRALISEPDAIRDVASALPPEAEDLRSLYFAWCALGVHNPEMQPRLLLGLLYQTRCAPSVSLLAATLALDRQIPFPRTAYVDNCLNTALAVLLVEAANQAPEVAFALRAISAYRWSWRATQRRPVSGPRSDRMDRLPMR